MDHTGRKRTPAAVLPATLILLICALALAACGGSGSSDGSPAPDYEAAIAKAPPKLAGIYEQGDAVVDGGEETYEETLASVRGYPVVVNNWASWCIPCRDEFPYFQDQAADRLGEVAFLGVNSEDFPDAAETFLRDNPLPYPSIEAPDKGEFSSWVGEGLVGLPNTVFYDAAGKLVHVQQGPYTSEDDLAADIDRYASSG